MIGTEQFCWILIVAEEFKLSFSKNNIFSWHFLEGLHTTVPFIGNFAKPCTSLFAEGDA